MDARKVAAAAAVGLMVSLLAQPAPGAEAPVPGTRPAVPVVTLDQELFRRELDGFVRELSEQIRSNVEEQIRRELTPRIVLASDEQRARG